MKQRADNYTGRCRPSASADTDSIDPESFVHEHKKREFCQSGPKTEPTKYIFHSFQVR